MTEYLNPSHPDAWVDYPPVERKANAYPQDTMECPRCKGHGGWNLRLNAYKLPDGYEDTSENRHKYVHFRSNCNNCNGWGYVNPNSRDATCIHDYKFLRNVGNCLNTYKCGKCGKEVTYDSSD